MSKYVIKAAIKLGGCCLEENYYKETGSVGRVPQAVTRLETSQTSLAKAGKMTIDQAKVSGS